MRLPTFTRSLLFLLTLLPLLSRAQDEGHTTLLRKSLWRVGLINFVRPAISHELRLTRKVSLLTVAALRTDYVSDREINRPTIWYRSLAAQATLSARYYYNLDRRFASGKDTDYNSGNYISLGAYYLSPVLTDWGNQSLYTRTYTAERSNTACMRALWGIQRRLPPKQFYYDLAVGFQINTHKPPNAPLTSFTTQLAIGYSFPK